MTTLGTEEAGGHAARLGDFVRTIWANRWVIGVLLIALAGQAALEPASAWITKEVLNSVQNAGTTVEDVVRTFAVPVLLILGGLVVLKFAEKVTNKAVEVRLIISLQRIYLERRQEEHAARDVSQVLYGCEQAKKGLEVIYKDAWKIGAATISVLVWQVSLGAQWIPLMLLAVIPSLMLVWFFGPPIQRLSLHILDLQTELAATTGRAENGTFASHQESWFRMALVLEVFKWLADDALDVIMWTFLAVIILVAYFLDLGILPDVIEIGGAAAFIINLKLLAKPLGDIGKVYTKWREAYPAASRVFAHRI